MTDAHPTPMGPIHLLDELRPSLPFGDQITALDRLPLSPQTDRIACTLVGGSERIVIWKRTTAREHAVYRRLFAPDEEARKAAGAPTLLGYDDARQWLFLEPIPEVFYDPTDPGEIARVYTHLGQFHVASPQASTLPQVTKWSITPHDLSVAFQDMPAASPHANEAAAWLSTGPVALIHGDFHRWNISLSDGSVRVWDWEYATFTHPIWDLVLLHPDPTPGWTEAPHGPMSELALSSYFAAGPLQSMGWAPFRRLHHVACLFVAARSARQHRLRAAQMEFGPLRDLVLDSARYEGQRITLLLASLGWA
jgi:hypothetical protein